MTSNLGSEFAFEENKDLKIKEYDNLIKQYFKPEFINRIDEIIIFNPLDKENIKLVADKFLRILKNRLKENDIELSIDKKALDKIWELGFDDKLGARPMKRHIQRNIESLLARYLLENPNDRNIELYLDENDNYKLRKV